MLSLAFFSMPHGWELFAILLIGLLLFGKRLPEVGRSLGRGIVEFKRGVKGFEDEIEQEASRPSKPAQRLEGDSRTVAKGAAEPRETEPVAREGAQPG